VQKGAICLAGILCSSDNRNLLDFNDITVDSEGRALGAYADGCVAPPIGGCSAANNYTGRLSKAAIVRQSDGRRLFAAFDVALSSVVSRKTHGSAGDFDINVPLAGTRTVECRNGNGTYTLVFTFPNVLTSVGGISTSATGPTQPGPSTGSIDTDPHKYIVNLTGVPNAQYITVTLNNVHDAIHHVGDVSATLGVLVGDVTGNGTASNTDVSNVKAQVAAPVTASNFRNDVTANGVISNTDVSTTKAQVGTTLPSSP
jgi:hypothetical protein